MPQKVSNLGLQPLAGGHKTCGTGFIVLPDLITRQDYITRCFNTSYVSIHIEGSGLVNNVVITEKDLLSVIFPKLPGELGSQVVYVTDQEQQQLFIVGVLVKNGRTGLEENIQKISRTVDTTTTSFVLNPTEGVVSITVQSAALSNLLVNLLSESQSALLQFIVNGFTSFVGKSLMMKQTDEILLKVKHPTSLDTTYLSMSPKELKLGATERIELGDGQEAAVLGNQLKQFLSDFITEVSNSTVSTPQGQVPLLNKLKIYEFKDKLDDLLSDLVSLE